MVTYNRFVFENWVSFREANEFIRTMHGPFLVKEIVIEPEYFELIGELDDKS